MTQRSPCLGVEPNASLLTWWNLLPCLHAGIEVLVLDDSTFPAYVPEIEVPCYMTPPFALPKWAQWLTSCLGGTTFLFLRGATPRPSANTAR